MIRKETAPHFCRGTVSFLPFFHAEFSHGQPEVRSIRDPRGPRNLHRLRFSQKYAQSPAPSLDDASPVALSLRLLRRALPRHASPARPLLQRPFGPPTQDLVPRPRMETHRALRASGRAPAVIRPRDRPKMVQRSRRNHLAGRCSNHRPLRPRESPAVRAPAKTVLHTPRRNEPPRNKRPPAPRSQHHPQTLDLPSPSSLMPSKH